MGLLWKRCGKFCGIPADRSALFPRIPIGLLSYIHKILDGIVVGWICANAEEDSFPILTWDR